MNPLKHDRVFQLIYLGLIGLGAYSMITHTRPLDFYWPVISLGLAIFVGAFAKFADECLDGWDEAIDINDEFVKISTALLVDNELLTERVRQSE